MVMTTTVSGRVVASAISVSGFSAQRFFLPAASPFPVVVVVVVVVRLLSASEEASLLIQEGRRPATKTLSLLTFSVAVAVAAAAAAA